MTATNFTPGPTLNTVRSADGTVLMAPTDWILLPPGDAALTRRVKAAGDHWVVQEKRGRKIFPRGVWASAAIIEKIRVDLEAERSTEGYARRKEADARRRDNVVRERGPPGPVRSARGGIVDRRAGGREIPAADCGPLRPHLRPRGSGRQTDGAGDFLRG